MTARLPAALASACAGLLLAGGASSAPPLAPGPPASARGLAVEIVAPNQSRVVATDEAVAPPGTAPDPEPFSFPDDGSVVSAESMTTSVFASAADGTAASVTELTKLALFGGEITADAVKASVTSAGTIGAVWDSSVSNLVVLGQPVDPVIPELEVPLADWGSLLLLDQTTARQRAPAASWRGTVTAVVVKIVANHGGLPAGTTIRVGFADAYARSPEPVGTTSTSTSTTASTATAPTTTSAGGARNAPAPRGDVQEPHGLFGGGLSFGSAAPARPKPAAKPKRKQAPAGEDGLPVLTTVPDVTPELTGGGYVFPVYGPSAYGDTFGAPRGDVSGGWHHGDDIFAPLGAPVLAAADGTIFSVGWNDVGGWRLWLRDRAGNEFYYAHLSAYTTLAADGRQVKAGDVVGFVGSTGDAEGTPFHLHFEVHPAPLLFLDYDGAVDPTPYLTAWKRLEDVRILPAVPFSAPGAEPSRAPAPGAILLQSSDISTANGLDPASLTRAMNRIGPAELTVPRIADLPVPLPILDRA